MKQKKIAIIQPYLFPYMGYFQLINYVDAFVVYDNVQYTKKGWFNRNSFLFNGESKKFTIPLKKDSDFKDVFERVISNESEKEIKKILAQIKISYRLAKHFNQVFPLIENILLNNEKNLFRYVKFSIESLMDVLEIDSQLLVSSELQMNHRLKSKDRVLKICELLNATDYINPQGGINLYDKNEFSLKGINLKFLFKDQFNYNQNNESFVDNLSIIDVLMFEGFDGTKTLLNNFTLK